MADKPDLSGIWRLLNVSYGGIDANNPDSQSALQAIQQYDPSARFIPVQDSQGQAIGYSLSADLSKLPQINGQSLGGQIGEGGAGYGGAYREAGGNWARDVKDPSQVVNDPNYGAITDYKNINYNDSGDNLFRMLGLAGVGGFALGIPSLASAMSNGAIGAGAAASNAVNPMYDMGPWSGTGPADMVPGTGATGIAAGGAAPIVESGTPARVGDVVRNGGIPGFDNIRQSISELPVSSLARGASSLLGGNSPGLLGSGGGGSSTSGLLGGGPVEDALSILKRFYAPDPLIALRQRRGH